jgi:hypothetical protein
VQPTGANKHVVTKVAENRSGFCTGSDRNMTASINEKIVVFAPIPSESEKRATAVIAGLRSMARKP